jgi:hypothetical protein
MGHVAFAISDTQLLLHGGVGADSMPTDEVWLLDAPPMGPWRWWVPTTSETSVDPPRRAWHTATRAGDNLVVVGYGIDTALSKTSNDLFFLRMENDSSWTWCSSYSPPSVVTLEPTPVPTTPPAVTKAAVVSAWTPTTSIVWATPASSAPVVGIHVDAADEGQQASGQTVKAVAGSVGGVLGAAVLAGLVGLYLRKRAANQSKRDVLWTPGPPVSALQYTRPAHQRNLSLGSTLTARAAGARAAGAPAAGDMRQPITQGDLLNFLYPSAPSSTSSEEQDPFSDDHAPRSQPTSASASVASYPYLTALPMASNPTSSSTASTIMGGAGTPRQPAIVVQSPSSDGGSDHLTRLPSRRTSTRRVSAPLRGSATVASPLAPSSPFVVSPAAGLLRITNPREV